MHHQTLNKTQQTKRKLIFLFCIPALFATSAAIAGSSIDPGAIEKCNRNFGSLAVAEPQSQILTYLGRYSLGSPSTMLRMIVQESGCFTVLERGVAMQNLQQERALAAGGQLQEGSNIGAGQLQGADFVMTPAIQFSDDSGGVSGAMGGLLHKMGGMLGAIGGLGAGVQFKEAETSLLIADVRSGIQVASAEGEASKMNFSLNGWGWGRMGWASAGGYSKTPEGKLIAASLLDNFNKIVLAVRDKPQLIQTTVQSSKINAAHSIQSTNGNRPVFNNNATPNTMPGIVIPATLVGMYNTKYDGDDQGTVTIMVSGNGKVSGMGNSIKFKTNFALAGAINSSGEINLVGQIKSVPTKFTCNIDPQSGTIMGIWQTQDNDKQGTFNGSKQ
ncbi:CsgG/HfaB family protein [Undibacterium sp. SXout20W]|uniref:CsgG/HfaB family protein n=1 Tax=Undibacterium sp. SXout20W TaxID=3413051 RepID=UPI003BF455CA